MADLDEAARKEVEEEAPDELLRSNEGGPAILGAESNTVVVHGEEAVVGDPNSVGVSAEVLEEVLRTSEWRLGIDDPALLEEAVFEIGEGSIVGEIGAAPTKAELAASPRGGDGHEQFRAKDLGDGLPGKRNLLLYLPVLQRKPISSSPARPPSVTMQWRCLVNNTSRRVARRKGPGTSQSPIDFWGTGEFYYLRALAEQ